MQKDQLIALARQTAAAHGLAAELVCAVCEQESGWNEFAIRYEPGFYTRYIELLIAKHQLTDPTEERARAFSWGLMQVMGEVARERGFAGRFLANLCDPWVGLEFGCRHLKSRLDAAGGNVERGLQMWNGGGNANYASEVMARMGNYTAPAAVSAGPQMETVT